MHCTLPFLEIYLVEYLNAGYIPPIYFASRRCYTCTKELAIILTCRTPCPPPPPRARWQHGNHILQYPSELLTQQLQTESSRGHKVNPDSRMIDVAQANPRHFIDQEPCCTPLILPSRLHVGDGSRPRLFADANGYQCVHDSCIFRFVDWASLKLVSLLDRSTL